MATWCLPKSLTNAFLEAIKSGELAPERLMDMSSAERREAFGKILGEENAREVNAQFEQKMLLKDQKAGLVAWAQKIGGLTEPARRDIIAQIERLDRVLQPEDERKFLADLAAKRLGVTVTAEEAKQIYDLSRSAEAARTTMLADIDNLDNRIAYGRAVLALTERINELKPQGNTFTNRLSNVIGLPKTLMSTLDLSAPFVQGWGMMTTSEFWSGFGKMFQYFASEENYRDLEAWIVSHPDYDLAKSGKLGLTNLGDRVVGREESIQSSLADEAAKWLSDRTGVPNLVRASNRAFDGFINYVRMARFVDLIRAARAAGEDVRPGSQAVKDIASAVNDFTGRGNLGKGDRFSAASPALNAALFAPRKIAATVQMFNPQRFVDPRISPTARRAAFRQLLGSVAATGAVIALARSMGAQVNLDPRSTDFLKIQIGDIKFDISGGNATYIRLWARIITGEQINSHGKLTELGSGFGVPSRADLVVQFFRGKLAPLASGIADALYGKTAAGQPFELTDQLRDKLIPLTVGGLIDFFVNDSDNTAAIVPALASIFGVGMQSPLPPMSKSGRNVWGEPLDDGMFSGASRRWRADPVNQEMDQLGYTPGFPMDQIRGVKLTGPQYDDYVRQAGRLAHMRLTDIMASPGWDAIPAPQRLKVVKGTIQKSRDMAATQIMLSSQGSANDIMVKATQAKMAAMGMTP